MSMLEFIGEIGRAEKIHRKPHVPRDKAYNAISSYCPKVSYEDIEILIDETVFGNAKVGIIITADGIHGKENFCDPFHYEMGKVASLFAKKSLMATTLYINERQVIKLTQPSGSGIVHLFNRIELYLRQSTSAAKAEVQSQPKVQAPPSVDPLPVVQQPVATEEPQATAALPSEAIAHPVEDAPAIDEQPSASKFRRWPKDDLINSIQTNKHLNSVFNFIGDVLSDNNASKTETLRREVSGFLSKTILRLRKDYIDQNQVIGLMNDIATLELAIYSIAVLRFELSSRRVDPRLIAYSLNEGVKAFLSLDNSTSSRTMLDNVLHLAQSMGDSLDDILFSFYMRMVTSNMKGALADDEMEMRMMRSAVSFNKTLAPEQAMENLVQELVLGALSEIGDISGNRHIGHDAQRCADRLIDLF